MTANKGPIIDLPSGARCVRIDDETRRYVFSAAGASLTVEDVEALYADSIGDSGGRALPEPRPAADLCGTGGVGRHGCGLAIGHAGICVPRWFCDALGAFK
jgi:hypothetical protein